MRRDLRPFKSPNNENPYHPCAHSCSPERSRSITLRQTFLSRRPGQAQLPDRAPVALMTTASLCAGALIRYRSFAKISSLPGIVASAFTSATVKSLPSTMPSLNWNSAFSFAHLANALASRNRIARRKATEAHALQALECRRNLLPLACLFGQLVLHHAILAARLANHLAQRVILRHGQLRKRSNNRRRRSLQTPSSAARPSRSS